MGNEVCAECSGVCVCVCVFLLVLTESPSRDLRVQVSGLTPHFPCPFLDSELPLAVLMKTGVFREPWAVSTGTGISPTHELWQAVDDSVPP